VVENVRHEREAEVGTTFPVGGRAVLCNFCKHWYIQPCNKVTQVKCPNMIAKRGQQGSEQASIRHHYIPVFYLKRWGGEDKKICEFSRPYKLIYTKRIYPVQTGFVDRLYEMKGVPTEMAQVVEDEFIKPADSLAARSLSMLESNNERITFESKYRSAWSLFLMTLLMRMPEDLEFLGQALADDWQRELPKMKERYVTKRRTNDPPTLQEFIDQNDPHHMSRWTLDVATKLMDHERIGQLLNDMRWFVLTTSGDAPQLLTSDRPILISGALTEADAYLFLPLGPRRLFVATSNIEVEQRIRRRPINEVVDGANKLVVQHAIKYVYGADDGGKMFVDENIGKSRPKSLMQKLREYRNEKAAARKK
jgi:hypothetical protein